MEKQIVLPSRNEMVVCKVLKVMPYGVTAELVEYPNVEGFIHISEVASSWIKNIRNYVKENEIKVAKILYVDYGKKHVDMSFTKVNQSQGRAAMNEYRFTKRAQRLMELIGQKVNKTPDEAWDAVAEPLIQEHGSLLKAFDKIKTDGKSAVANISPIYQSALLDVVDSNIAMPTRMLRGQFAIKCMEADGVEVIRQAFMRISKTKGVDQEVHYLGGGKYMLKVSSPQFKTCEKALKEASEGLLANLKGKKCEAAFTRLED